MTYRIKFAKLKKIIIFSVQKFFHITLTYIKSLFKQYYFIWKKEKDFKKLKTKHTYNYLYPRVLKSANQINSFYSRI